MADAEVARLQQELAASNTTRAKQQQELQSVQCRAQSRYRDMLFANRRAEQLEAVIGDKDFILQHEMTKRLSVERSLGAVTEQLEQLKNEKAVAIAEKNAAFDILGKGCTKEELEKERQKMKAQNEQEIRLHKLATDQDTRNLRASWQEKTRKENEHLTAAYQQLQNMYQESQEEIKKLKQSEQSLTKELTWHKEKLQQRAREEPTGVITHPIGLLSPMRDPKKRKLNENGSPSSPHHFSPRQPPAVSPGRNQHMSPLGRPPLPEPNFWGAASPSRAAPSAHLGQTFAATGTHVGFKPSQLQDFTSVPSTRAGTPNTFQQFPVQNGFQNLPPPSRPGSANASTLLNSPLLPGMGLLFPQTPTTPSRKEAQFEELKQEQRYFSPGQRVRFETMTDAQKWQTLAEFRARRLNLNRGTQQANIGQGSLEPLRYNQFSQTSQRPPPQYNVFNQNGQQLQQATQQQHNGSNVNQRFGVSLFGQNPVQASHQQSSQQVQQQPRSDNNAQLHDMFPQSQTPVSQMRPIISPPSRQNSNTPQQPVQYWTNGAVNPHPMTTAEAIPKSSHAAASTPTPSPPNVSTNSQAGFALTTSPPTFVPRFVPCLRCYANWWESSCDSGEPCSNCEADTMSKSECVRMKCKDFAAGTCKRKDKCTRAHEDDRYDVLEANKSGMPRKGRKTDLHDVAPSLRVGSSQNSQGSAGH